MSRPIKKRPLVLMAGVALLAVHAWSFSAYAETQDPAESLRALFEKKTSAAPASKDASPAPAGPAAGEVKSDGPLPIIPAAAGKAGEPVAPAPASAPVAPRTDVNSPAAPSIPAAQAVATPSTPAPASPVVPTVPSPTAASLPLTPPAPASQPMAAPLPRVPAPDDATLQDISSIKGEISLLTLKLQREKLLKELHQVQTPEKPAGEQIAPHQPAAEAASPAQSAATRFNHVDLPSVVEISGSAGRLSATISSSDGGEVHARKGQRVPGGFRIRDIDTQGVLFERDGGGGQSWYVGVGVQTRQTRVENGPQPAGMTPIPLQ